MCGLVWQVVNVFGLYFQYKASTRIKIQIPDVLPPVDTSLCTRFTDVLDYDRLNSETNRSWQYSISGTDVQKYQDEITVSEIFEYTPDVREVVARVVFRDIQSYQRLEYPGSTAYDYVRVHKYVYSEFVCYRIRDQSSSKRRLHFLCSLTSGCRDDL